MAKVAFSKLGLKKTDETSIVNVNGIDIEVKHYLPINDKLILITNVMNQAINADSTFKNPVKIELFGSLAIVEAYTNLSFTEKQKEDPCKLYDLLDTNGVFDTIFPVIPQEEYEFVIEGIDSSMDAFYNYQNSVMGILDRISTDYSNLDMDAANIQSKIADPQNLELLKNIMSKLG